MIDTPWTNGEKKVARRAFDAAVQRELAQLVAEFKAKAERTKDVEALWEIRDWLDRRQREIDADFDFRYSQLLLVFARLIRAGKMKPDDLTGLSEQKLSVIRLRLEL